MYPHEWRIAIPASLMRVDKGPQKAIVRLFFFDFLESGAWIRQSGAWNCQMVLGFVFLLLGIVS